MEEKGKHVFLFLSLSLLLCLCLSVSLNHFVSLSFSLLLPVSLSHWVCLSLSIVLSACLFLFLSLYPSLCSLLGFFTVRGIRGDQVGRRQEQQVFDPIEESLRLSTIHSELS